MRWNCWPRPMLGRAGVQRWPFVLNVPRLALRKLTGRLVSLGLQGSPATLHARTAGRKAGRRESMEDMSPLIQQLTTLFVRFV